MQLQTLPLQKQHPHQLRITPLAHLHRLAHIPLNQHLLNPVHINPVGLVDQLQHAPEHLLIIAEAPHQVLLAPGGRPEQTGKRFDDLHDF